MSHLIKIEQSVRGLDAQGNKCHLGASGGVTEVDQELIYRMSQIPKFPRDYNKSLTVFNLPEGKIAIMATFEAADRDQRPWPFTHTLIISASGYKALGANPFRLLRAGLFSKSIPPAEQMPTIEFEVSEPEAEFNGGPPAEQLAWLVSAALDQKRTLVVLPSRNDVCVEATLLTLPLSWRADIRFATCIGSIEEKSALCVQRGYENPAWTGKGQGFQANLCFIVSPSAILPSTNSFGSSLGNERVLDFNQSPPVVMGMELHRYAVFVRSELEEGRNPRQIAGRAEKFQGLELVEMVKMFEVTRAAAHCPEKASWDDVAESLKVLVNHSKAQEPEGLQMIRFLNDFLANNPDDGTIQKTAELILELQKRAANLSLPDVMPGLASSVIGACANTQSVILPDTVFDLCRYFVSNESVLSEIQTRLIPKRIRVLLGQDYFSTETLKEVQFWRQDQFKAKFLDSNGWGRLLRRAAAQDTTFRKKNDDVVADTLAPLSPGEKSPDGCKEYITTVKSLIWQDDAPSSRVKACYCATLSYLSNPELGGDLLDVLTEVAGHSRASRAGLIRALQTRKVPASSTATFLSRMAGVNKDPVANVFREWTHDSGLSYACDCLQSFVNMAASKPSWPALSVLIAINKGTEFPFCAACWDWILRNVLPDRLELLKQSVLSPSFDDTELGFWLRSSSEQFLKQPTAKDLMLRAARHKLSFADEFPRQIASAIDDVCSDAREGKESFQDLFIELAKSAKEEVHAAAGRGIIWNVLHRDFPIERVLPVIKGSEAYRSLLLQGLASAKHLDKTTAILTSLRQHDPDFLDHIMASWHGPTGRGATVERCASFKNLLRHCEIDAGGLFLRMMSSLRLNQPVCIDCAAWISKQHLPQRLEKLVKYGLDSETMPQTIIWLEAFPEGVLQSQSGKSLMLKIAGSDSTVSTVADNFPEVFSSLLRLVGSNEPSPESDRAILGLLTSKKDGLRSLACSTGISVCMRDKRRCSELIPAVAKAAQESSLCQEQIARTLIQPVHRVNGESAVHIACALREVEPGLPRAILNKWPHGQDGKKDACSAFESLVKISLEKHDDLWVEAINSLRSGVCNHCLEWARQYVCRARGLEFPPSEVVPSKNDSEILTCHVILPEEFGRHKGDMQVVLRIPPGIEDWEPGKDGQTSKAIMAGGPSTGEPPPVLTAQEFLPTKFSKTTESGQSQISPDAGTKEAKKATKSIFKWLF